MKIIHREIGRHNIVQLHIFKIYVKKTVTAEI